MPKKYIPKYDLKQLTAVIPINCPDLDQLVSGTSICADRLRILLHQIYVAWIYAELSDDKRENYFHTEGWVTLCSKRLRTLLTDQSAVYEDLLESERIIEISRANSGNKSYISNSRCTPYRIKPSLLVSEAKERFRHEKITNYRCLVSIYHDRNKLQEQIYSVDVSRVNAPLPVHDQMKSMLDAFYFDQISLGEYLSSVRSGNIVTNRKTSRGLLDAEMLTHLINEGSMFNTVVDQFGERYHSVHTRLPREYRHFLRIKGYAEPLCCVDIANCQPYLVALVCCHPDLIMAVLPEFGFVLERIKSVQGNTRRHFFELCASGTIYEFWLQARSLSSRDEAKGEIIERILFDSLFYQKKKYAKALKKFIELFPDVLECVAVMKSISEVELPLIMDIALDERGNFGGSRFYHKTISCMCQRLESRLMIHAVVPALINKGLGPFLTVHDSIVLPRSKAEEVKQIIIDRFTSLGVQPPKLKIDVYGTISSSAQEKDGKKQST